MISAVFLLAVITAPGEVQGEADILEGMLEAGLQRLHIRKPGGSVAPLWTRLAPRWGSKIVVHGGQELPDLEGNIHGVIKGARSVSVHSWEELMRLPPGLDYAFISPVFDSISKPDYPANSKLLQMPPGPYPCRPVGLGGVNAQNIERMIEMGWTGAAVLGWIWKQPRHAMDRFEQLKRVIDGQAKSIGSGGV